MAAGSLAWGHCRRVLVSGVATAAVGTPAAAVGTPAEPPCYEAGNISVLIRCLCGGDCRGSCFSSCIEKKRSVLCCVASNVFLF